MFNTIRIFVDTVEAFFQSIRIKYFSINKSPELDLYRDRVSNSSNKDYWYFLVQKVLLFFVPTLIAIVFFTTFEEFLISKTATISIKSEYWYLSPFYYILILLLAFFLGFRLFRFFYRVSLLETSISFSVITIYLILKSGVVGFLKEEFHYANSIFKFFDPLMILWGTFILGSLFNYLWPKFGKARNYFIEDNPTKNTAPERILNQLKYSIFHDKYEKSFSIGIIGPWGQGKSSFIEILKEHVINYQLNFPKNDPKYYTYTPKGNQIGYQEIVLIEFSPFLNHNDDLIINDFFLQLSHKLKHRSGKLSNTLLTYSQKLVNLIEDKKFTSILKNEVSFNANKDVTLLYQEINELLQELELKFVIIIDDLDRLNPKEILQVLKLIRNTSNFPNFVFVVALDKEYVISAISSFGDYADNGFIDKFFQLECFLPENDNNDLIEYTIELINNAPLPISTKTKVDPKQILTKSISNEVTLFHEYVKNFRDSKKLVNQIIFENNIIENQFEEVLARDYVYLLLLRLKFPFIYRLLCENTGELLRITGELYSLKKNEPENKTPDISDLINKDQYSKPDLSNIDFGSSFCSTKKTQRYDNLEIDLIKRTLYELFEANSNPPFNSVKHVKVFNKIKYWRISANDLSYERFSQLINSRSSLHNASVLLDSLIDDNLQAQFINRLNLDLLPIADLEDFQTSLKFLLTFKNKFNYNSKEFARIIDIIEKHIVQKPAFMDSIPDILSVGFLFETKYSLIERIDFLIQITNNEPYTKLWGYKSKKGINDDILKIIADYFEKSTTIEPGDYTISRLYYFLLDQFDKDDFTKMKRIFAKFFEKITDPIPLCFNLLEPDRYTANAFSINKVVEFLFENLTELEKFIISKTDTPATLEFLHFLRLIKIVGNNKKIIFNFSKRVLLKDFIEFGINWNDDTLKSIKRSKQLILKIDDEKISSYVHINMSLSITNFVYEDGIYMILEFKDIPKHQEAFTSLMNSILGGLNRNNKVKSPFTLNILGDFVGSRITDLHGGTSVEVISYE